MGPVVRIYYCVQILNISLVTSFFRHGRQHFERRGAHCKVRWNEFSIVEVRNLDVPWEEQVDINCGRQWTNTNWGKLNSIVIQCTNPHVLHQTWLESICESALNLFLWSKWCEWIHFETLMTIEYPNCLNFALESFHWSKWCEWFTLNTHDLFYILSKHFVVQSWE